MRLRCDLRDPLSWLVFYRGWVDAKLEKWLRAWLRSGDTYVDVGAHIGFFVSIALEKVGHEGRVIALEPYDETFSKLALSVEEIRHLYPHIEIHHAAAGSSSGLATLLHPTDAWEHETSRASLVDAPNLTPSSEVRVITLDSILAESHCRVLKIDVEGYEAEVIRGASRLLAERRADALLMELNPSALERAGSSSAELLDILAEHGYRIHAVSKNGRFERGADLDGIAEFADAIFLPSSP